jgi:hypothetical protein
MFWNTLEKAEISMPFLDDTGADDEVLQRPVWGTFALLKDNLERLLATNVGWTLQVLPALAALGFPQLPDALRVLLLIYSATALAPATGLLFVWMSRVCHQEPLRLESLPEDLRTLTLPALLHLAPLYGSLGVCYLAIVFLGLFHVLLLDVLLRLLLLLLTMCALYWGPLFADDPTSSPFLLARQALLLFWRYPGATMLLALLVLLLAALGICSVVGFLLLMPALVALVETRCYQFVRKRARARTGTAKAGVL